MKKDLNIPINWQDFEDLCKELWREVWKCLEIQSHGRNGQSQNGVDIFGVPDGETDYYAIQCKHKKIGEQLTEHEIDSEIEKAKTFHVPLKMLYIATTAENDAKTQKYVLTKDVENRKNNLFGIRVYSWQEISDLLRRHKKVLEWYLTEKFNNHSIKLIINGFITQDEEIILNPKYIRKITETIYREPIKINSDFQKRFAPWTPPPIKKDLHVTLSLHNSKFIRNKSLVKLSIGISNVGDDPIENYYLFIKISDEDYSTGIHFQNSDVLINEDNEALKLQEFRFDQNNEIINSGMLSKTSTYINLPKKNTKVYLTFEFYSKNHKDNGTIIINNVPEIEIKEKIKFTDKKEEVNCIDSIEVITEEEYISAFDLLNNY